MSIIKPSDMHEYLQKSVEMFIKEKAIKIAEDAAEKLRKEVASEVDKLALSIMKEYSIRDMGTHIIIEVKKHN